MKNMKKIITILFLALAINSFSQDTITTEKSKDFMDKTVVVVGKVISYRLASEGKYLNYINIDKAYPDNIFSIVITNDYLEKLNIKIEDLKNKVIYIKGKISTYKNDPKQIPQIYNPMSIQIKKD
jgi:PBP1b-binding outer membrane lipoprotein LpoB